jgi:WD40 repeat protein
MLSGQRIALLAGFGRYVSGVAFSQDGRWLAAGTDDGNLQIWDVAGRRRMHAMRVGWAYVSTPAFSPDGKLVAAGTYADGTVTLVDVASGAILSQIQVSMFGCGSVAFSPDGRYLLTPSNSGTLQSGRFEKGGSIRVFEVTR